MASFNIRNISETIVPKENNQLMEKQPRSSSSKRHRSRTIHATSNQSTNQHKHRSSSFSNGIDQVMDFIQQKFSHTNDAEKQDFDDLTKIK
jgi:hypothetical protein